MEKFLTAFSRSQPGHRREEEGRSYQFAKKRLSAYSPLGTPTAEKEPGPTLALSDLTALERDAFLTWWHGMDPFGVGLVQVDILLSFLVGSGLSQDALRQVIKSEAKRKKKRMGLIFLSTLDPVHVRG